MVHLRSAFLGLMFAGVALCTLSPSVESAAKKKVNPAATPVTRGDKVSAPYFFKQHDSFLAVAKKGGADVVFFGDQFTEMWRHPVGKAAWDKTFGELKAVNFGLSSDHTQHLLWRIQNGELSGKPKVAVVMIGYNNIRDGRDSVEQIAEGITAIVKSIQKASPKTKVLLLGNFETGFKSDDATKVIELNKLTAKLDDGKKVKFLAVNSSFMKDGQWVKEYFQGGGPPVLNQAGFQVWADAIAPVLKEMLGKD